MKKLGIYGCGGAGRESKEIAEMMGKWSEIFFIDDAYDDDIFKDVRRMNYAHFIERYSPEDTEVSISLGEPELKVKLYERLKADGYSLADIIHPSSHISPSASYGHGLILKSNALISTNAIVGENVSIEENGIVGHDSTIGNNCQISANVIVAGGCQIGEATYIGLNVPIKQGTKIGNNCIIGMGSVVLRDIPDNVIALGNPARPMKNKDDSRVFK